MSLFEHSVSFKSELSLTHLLEKVSSNAESSEYSLVNDCKNNDLNSVEMLLRPKNMVSIYVNSFLPVLTVKIEDNGSFSRILVMSQFGHSVRILVTLYFFILSLIQTIILGIHCFRGYSLNLKIFIPIAMIILLIVFIRIGRNVVFKKTFDAVFHNVDKLNLQKERIF